MCFGFPWSLEEFQGQPFTHVNLRQHCQATYICCFMDVDFKKEGKELNSPGEKKRRYTEATSDHQIWSIETNHQKFLLLSATSFGRFASSEKKAKRNQVAIVENHQLQNLETSLVSVLK